MHFGIVVIGRNEGNRLRVCLESAIAQASQVVYVDSGSTDNSIKVAQALGVWVVPLDLGIPFTAARARNTGLDQLVALAPELSYVQFIDGDCELVKGWCATAQAVLQEHPQVAVVCGQRRERFPEQSIFNHLCDLEWNTPIGEALACGGDALMRISTFKQLGGYNPTLIAGEEPELCLRMRQQGWRILRIDHDMTRHDAQITEWNQWWRRSVRAGHAYAEVSWIHRQDPERFWQRESLRIWGWAFGIPLLIGMGWSLSGQWSGLLGIAYVLLIAKIFRQFRDQYGPRSAFYYAVFCVLAKFPELQGQGMFHLKRWQGDRNTLIEYK